MAWLLAGGAVALTAGIVVANLNWYADHTKADYTYLKNIQIQKLDGSNSFIPATDLWRKAGAVIMVVRRPG